MQYVRERKECSETYREAEIDRDSERKKEEREIIFLSAVTKDLLLNWLLVSYIKAG